MSHRAQELDRSDPLKHCREWFSLPQDTVYLDGNSLGALPKHVATRVKQTLEVQWGQDLISSWNENDWINLPRSVGDKIAPIIGAKPGQVICTDSTSVNLFKLIGAALSLKSDRSEILSETGNFPTDLYIAEGISRFLGEDRATLRLVETNQLTEAISEKTALLLLTQVNFRNGAVHDLAKLTERAHEMGALVLWDLSHSAGILPIELDQHHVDFAVGCGYKYLNGGPGAPAYLYANETLLPDLSQPLTGWMGHTNAFDFTPDYKAAAGIEQFLTGTPGILSMAAFDAALDLFDQVTVAELREKSVRMTTYFIELTAAIPTLSLISPTDPDERGSQVSLTHPDAYAIVQAMIDRGVIGDFRAPDILRFGFAPLYNSFQEISRTVDIMADIINRRVYKEPRYQERKQVT